MFPPAQWLRAYEASWLGGDLIAGITLAAYAIPVSLAYAGLAGLPPQVGLYGYLLGGLGYALFGSSRQLAVGPTSAISLMVGGTVAQMAGGDAVRYAQIATLAGFVVALLSLLAWLLRLSTLTSFISETILLGFKAGAASIASILLLLRRTADPHVAFLGRIPNTRRFSDLARSPDNERLDGVLAFRVESSLLYFNVENVLRVVFDQLRAEPTPVRLVVCDLSSSPYVDVAGVRMLESLSEALGKQGIALRVVEALASTRDLLRAEGLAAKVGDVDRFTSVADVVEEFEKGTGCR